MARLAFLSVLLASFLAFRVLRAVMAATFIIFFYSLAFLILMRPAALTFASFLLPALTARAAYRLSLRASFLALLFAALAYLLVALFACLAALPPVKTLLPLTRTGTAALALAFRVFA